MQVRSLNRRALTLIALHLLLLVYSLSGIFSKNAAAQEFLSVPFMLFYAGMLAVLFVYAIGWQQILKRMALSAAFANKAVTVVWGMLWGWLIFGETISLINMLGAALVILGVIIYARADGREQRRGDGIDGDEWIVLDDGDAGSDIRRRDR